MRRVKNNQNRAEDTMNKHNSDLSNTLIASKEDVQYLICKTYDSGNRIESLIKNVAFCTIDSLSSLRDYWS